MKCTPQLHFIHRRLRVSPDQPPGLLLLTCMAAGISTVPALYSMFPHGAIYKLVREGLSQAIYPWYTSWTTGAVLHAGGLYTQLDSGIPSRLHGYLAAQWVDDHAFHDLTWFAYFTVNPGLWGWCFEKPDIGMEFVLSSSSEVSIFWDITINF